MAVTIIATAGATNANSYCTQAEAEAYFDTHLYTTEWDAASSTNKKIGLIWATRLLDQLMDWNGYIADEDQALRWPRTGVLTIDGVEVDDETIPQFLKNATAEFAQYLIKEDRTAEPETAGFSRLKAGEVEMNIDKSDRIEIMPDAVLQIVKDYGDALTGSPTVTLIRT